METARRDLGEGAWYQLAEGFVPDHEAVMATLIAELPLVQEPVRIVGKSDQVELSALGGAAHDQQA